MLVDDVRERLISSDAAFVIENVPRAPLMYPFILCGAAFGLGARCEDGVFRPLRRHRLFEASFFMLGTGCVCGTAEKCGVYGNGGGFQNRFAESRRGYKGNAAEMRAAIGADWMTTAELSESIPPAYSEWIGRQALQVITERPQGRPSQY
jgi:DNA (cytosine-5)-methyltransferase 1